MRLKERVAIVTGSGSGIGAAIAERFAAEGAVVIIADVNEAAGKAEAAKIAKAGGAAHAYTVDVTSRDGLQAFMKSVAAEHGSIDILVNNAGITRYRPFLEANDADWDAVLNIDLKGVFFCVQAAAPYFAEQKSGRVINISSSLGTGTSPHNAGGSPGGSSAYGSAKAGVILLTKTLARELGQHNVTVNCIAPGTFITPMTSSTRTPEQVEEHVAARKRANVLGRLGRVEELAAAAVFLASDEAGFISGHTLPVDGGRIDRM
ncbi:MAG: glucose 1-dehydrogenase [Amaricoccus sp.]